MSVRRLCVQWPRFGPYYLARLKALHELLSPHGVEVIGLETAVRDETYDWRIESDPTPFRREQVFTDRTFEQIHPREMFEAVTASLERINPDALAIHTYSFPDSRACLSWCRRRRRTAVLMTDTKEDDAKRVWWRERIKARIIRQYDAALLSGTSSSAYFQKLGFPKDNIFLGYDVVDNEHFRTQAESAAEDPLAYRDLPGLDSDQPFFLVSSRFIRRKNLERLLSAYAAYSSAVDRPWRLIILGDGPLRPELEALVAEKNISGAEFAGFRQINEIPAYYGRASVFVHPALTDTWALVVNEAMAARLPVLVSTGAGCAADLVENGINGYTFDPTKERELAELMTRISEPDTDLTAMGRSSQRIIQRWSPERFSESLWAAVMKGSARSNRPLDLPTRLLLAAIRATSTSVHSHHTVEA